MINLETVRYDFVMEQGVTFLLSLVWSDSNGVPIDLTGFNVKLRIIKNFAPTNQQFWLTFSSSGGGDANTSVTLGTTDGSMLFRAEDSVTEALTGFTKAPYSLYAKGPDGSTFNIMEGTVSIKAGVSW